MEYTQGPRSDGSSDQNLQIQWEHVLDGLAALRTFALIRALLPLGRAFVAASVAAGESDVLQAIHANRASKFLLELVSTSSMRST